ncbi:MAG: hypothetical protein OXC25_01385 [Thiotrichales bacterium]|nr:hypothetical protein [Thiotrichales bacterium]
MTEKEWTESIAHFLRDKLSEIPYRACSVETGRKIPYGLEARSYDDVDAPKPNVNQYETDLVVIDYEDEQSWKPRVIVEAKKSSVTTHDAITYSQKALSHKTVHPYLRYGIMLGDRKNYPLPGRLYRHGSHFDFMISFVGDRPSKTEIDAFGRIIRAEIDTSRKLEKIIYESRQRDREHYTILQRMNS